MPPLLSKSKFTCGIQCLRRLWLDVYRPEVAPPLDPVTEAIFAAGSKVGEVARGRFRGGVLVASPHYEYDTALAHTAELLADESVPAIFEAAFIYDGVRVRVDVLERTGSRWRLIEVKSSASLKDEHVPDLAIQHYVVTGSGLQIASDHLMRIDTSYVYDGQHLDPKRLFAIDDATALVSGALNDLPEQLTEQKAVLACSEEPQVEPGFQCASPWDCPFASYCMRGKPRYWVRSLPRISRTTFEELRGMGVEDILAIPDDFPLLPAQRLVRDALQSREAWVSSDLGSQLVQVGFPIHFLDFETFGPAMPRYRDTRPYQALPFQWSLHILERDGTMRHHGYLHDGDTDPRRDVARSVLDGVQDIGSVMVFYAGHERPLIRRLADDVPDLAAPLLGLLDRFVDLWAIVKSCYYHPDFVGSYSLKQVVPAMVPDCGYDDLGIQDGTIASLEYTSMLDTCDTDERERIRQNLLAYSERDTWAMVRIWEELSRLGGS
jgi:hypothetical protein